MPDISMLSNIVTIHALQTEITRHGLLVVVLMVFIAELGLPTGISPKVALVMVGGTAITTLPMLGLDLALVTASNLLGASTLHAVARGSGGWLGPRLMRGRGEHPERFFDRWRARPGGHDAVAIFAGRVTPVVRIYVTVATGVARIQWRDFLLGAGPAALVWSGGPLAVGYLFRDHVRRLTASPMLMETVALIVPLVGVFAVLVWMVHNAPSRIQMITTIQLGIAVGSGLATALWAVKVVRANALAHHHGAAALDLPVLTWWLAFLGAMILVAFASATRDVGPAFTPQRIFRPVQARLAGALVWGGALSAVMAVMIAIELLYPAL